MHKITTTHVHPACLVLYIDKFMGKVLLTSSLSDHVTLIQVWSRRVGGVEDNILIIFLTYLFVCLQIFSSSVFSGSSPIVPTGRSPPVPSRSKQM